MQQTLTVKTVASTTNRESKKSLCFLLVKIKQRSNGKETAGEKQLNAASGVLLGDTVGIKEGRGLPNFLLGTVRMEIETEQRRALNELHQIKS